ncbi:MAG: sigma-54 interaction domain-containing protein [Tepidisphaeraceae bacterium]
MQDALPTKRPTAAAPSPLRERLGRPLVGSSGAMSAVRDVASDVARRRSTVMILGETGSGKEMVARHIHCASDRAAHPFVPVDCTALSESIFESEMFGHVRGAFTGAIRDSLGIIRSADGGTLFLDELGELSLPMQAKLLRVLQERRVTPVGDSRPKAVDIRVLCATNRDLQEMVARGTFREDLYYRLNVVVVHVPPLRARLADIPALAEHFLRLQAELYDEPMKRLSQRALDSLLGYAWPGNVRELANVMEQAHVLTDCETIDIEHLPARLRQAGVSAHAALSDLHLPTLEGQAIAEALRRCKNNKSAASRLLGMNRQRLNRRLRTLGLDARI